ncbi:hypothetical protein LAA29_140047 [Leuconostoc carnosum]|nr:hypothetical protein LCAC16_240047 [Leuconostoc carnosum]SPO33640.1 hypothetical protein LAA29_140047 [Leuconostoc carnosum]
MSFSLLKIDNKEKHALKPKIMYDENNNFLSKRSNVSSKFNLKK